METKKKNTILIWAVVLLLIGNVATVSAIWISKINKNKPVKNSQYQKKQDNNKNRNYIINQLDLSDEQREQFKAAKQQYKGNIREIRDKIHKNKDLINEEVFKADPNLIYIEELSDSIGKLNAEFEKLNYEHFISIKQFLTTEQQQKFKNLIKEASGKHQKHRQRHRQNRLK